MSVKPSACAASALNNVIRLGVPGYFLGEAGFAAGTSGTGTGTGAEDGVKILATVSLAVFSSKVLCRLPSP
ncbi:MAG TPA: hypothetical protein VIF37_11645 [Methylobacter sp.]